MKESLSYKNSGVDIDIANATKKELKSMLKPKDPRILNGIGAFGSLYDIRFPEYKDPVIVFKTEEPGSKQLLAFQYDRYESIGIDMINHLINDCIVMGAKPLAVQDAIICGKHEKDKILRIISGISKACDDQGCALTGGEISEQPSVIPEGSYILTSSIIGIVDKPDIIDGSAIKEGDAVIAIESSGLHTNGYSLARKLLAAKPEIAQAKIGGISFIDSLLEPHRCYYNHIKDLFPQKTIRGMAHITGGGIKENLDRILPSNVDADIDLNLFRILPVFKFIRSEGNVPDDDMIRTFNLGAGFTIVCREKDASKIISHLQSKGLRSYIIGNIRAGSRKVITRNKLNWD